MIIFPMIVKLIRGIVETPMPVTKEVAIKEASMRDIVPVLIMPGRISNRLPKIIIKKKLIITNEKEYLEMITRIEYAFYFFQYTKYEVIRKEFKVVNFLNIVSNQKMKNFY